MLLTYVLFLLGFVALIKGADLLVEGASAIARKLHISDIVIGLTIISFGTSAPELAVSLLATSEGKSDLAIGNILGSNISNILLILGVAAIITPLRVHGNTIWKEIPFSLLAAVLIGILANDLLLDSFTVSAISRSDGLVLLCFLIIFMYYIYGMARSEPAELQNIGIQMNIVRAAIYIILGLLGLGFGGRWIVDGAVQIATSFNVSQTMIGITVLAIGTSLPELATSVVAAIKKNADIAVGNVVGSNILNVFWILGVSAAVSPLPFNAANNFDIGMTLLASVLLFLVVFVNAQRELLRWSGLLFVGMYIMYMALVVLRG